MRFFDGNFTKWYDKLTPKFTNKDEEKINVEFYKKNGFQIDDSNPLSNDIISNNIKNVIPEGSKLYISTDEKDKSFFDLLKEHYTQMFHLNFL